MSVANEPGSAGAIPFLMVAADPARADRPHLHRRRTHALLPPRQANRRLARTAHCLPVSTMTPIRRAAASGTAPG